MAKRLQWHTIAVTSSLYFSFDSVCVHSSCFHTLSLFHYQVAQLTYVLDGRLKELSEDVELEKALKEVSAAIAKEKVKAAETTKKKAVASEKARALAKKRSAELEMHLGGTELKLVEAESLNTAQAKDLADLKAALVACENKWYNEVFADAVNSAELVIRQA